MLTLTCAPGASAATGSPSRLASTAGVTPTRTNRPRTKCSAPSLPSLW
ncbi:Uncharacterised protein [Mycobacterium tuberculosis]|nr:Uncharacterised protein [Mycobacterium tuberculosis]